jgi:UDP-N-acetylglucosamine acyltransferase
LNSLRIHPTAVISPQAKLADNVTIGPHAVIEGKVIIGPDCILRAGAVLCGPLNLGRGNIVFSGTILGEKPQHLKYHNEVTSLEIGDGNTFREHVTIHRGTSHSMTTRIGSHNLFLAKSHVGHDCVVGDGCILSNGALVGGHCVISDNVYLSDNCAVHQFVHIGRLALLGACSITTKDIPPFVSQQRVNSVVGINVAGMLRAGMSRQQIQDVEKAFRILFHQGLPLPAALDRLEEELGAKPVVQEMITFLRQCNRGINSCRRVPLACPGIRKNAAGLATPSQGPWS